MLKVHEVTTPSGALSPVFVRNDGGFLMVVTADGEYPLPEGALDAIMERYGKPLGENVDLIDVAALDLGTGCALKHVRHLARYDVIARDYLVFERPGTEARCALATTVAGALEHVGRAAAAGR